MTVYTFEIDHVAEMELVCFMIKAKTKEEAMKFAQLINPTAKLIFEREDTSTVVV